MQESTFETMEPSPVSAADPALTVEQAIANLQGSDLGLRFYAAWWLGRFRVREDAAILALIAALEDEADQTEAGGYPLRRNAARALGKLGDLRAVPVLIRSLACSDYYVREAAAQALLALGDPACVPMLIDLLATGVQGDQLVPNQPDLSQPYDAILEAVGALRATHAIPYAKPFLEHPVERVQYAAIRAMYQLTHDSLYGDQLVQALDSPSLQLRRTILADLGAISYLPAAEAIAQTQAENSLKLIALKGLLEAQLQQTSPPDLTAGAIKVMTLMDDLL
ncbi:phycocyanobilin lyase [Leptolyngbya sp. 'hensonii']|uniref:HEAT repeat domain-containing protein n=1 Tax=Leptolyngbya sp. 'hensonii' TaxID=1922337 RepID=UPI00094FCDD4|nr:HEAT repeat domain-containing protein [Leptolyngbya sp. 'hensonii']OLP16656.1 phycocyanobilin lyase [Leptolyngbya sp. 'hensonii']